MYLFNSGRGGGPEFGTKSSIKRGIKNKNFGLIFVILVEKIGHFLQFWSNFGPFSILRTQEIFVIYSFSIINYMLVILLNNSH